MSRLHGIPAAGRTPAATAAPVTLHDRAAPFPADTGVRRPTAGAAGVVVGDRRGRR